MSLIRLIRPNEANKANEPNKANIQEKKKFGFNNTELLI